MKDLLSALHAHRRWLHALRCDTESQMLCGTHYVTHAHTHTHADITEAYERTSSEHAPGQGTRMCKHDAAYNMQYMLVSIK